jgi:uncharacterized iron-regulated membrane protein
MFSTMLHHPRKLWLRRALFQVHLWAGILLSLYAVVISLSGSILVFQDEIRLASLDQPPLEHNHIASINSVIALAHQSYPKSRLTYIQFPQSNSPWWVLYLTDEHGKSTIAYANASSGLPLPRGPRLFIDFVLDLHVYLLAGRNGFVVNCIAGMGLLLLAVTGAVLWWPGIRLWTRGLMVSLRHGWQRINYDLHSAVGIWTLAIVSWWGITAIYFLLPLQLAAAVNAISPLVGMKSPAAPAIAASSNVVPLDRILAELSAISSGHLSGVGLPESPGGIVTAYSDLRSPGDFSHRDIVTFDGHTGKVLTVWHYGDNHSLGDWFLWLMHPLHFGTLWGVGIKVLWSLLGLSVALLSITGLLMYWNRKLSKWCMGR